MRGEPLMKAMKVAISDVLETMFFLPVQFAEGKYSLKEWFPDIQSVFGATLRFNGPLSGALWLVAPVSVVNEITAGFLGLRKHEINDDQRRDTIKEALNMIGGHGFSLFNSKGAFNLSIPRSIEGAVLLENTYETSSEHSILIETEHNRLAAGVVIET
jgi:hypothetical protein